MRKEVSVKKRADKRKGNIKGVFLKKRMMMVEKKS